MKNWFSRSWGLGSMSDIVGRRREKKLKRKKSIKYKYLMFSLWCNKYYQFLFLTNVRYLFTISPIIKLQLYINCISQDMPSYAGIVNNFKNNSDVIRISISLSCMSIETPRLCSVSISTSTKELPLPISMTAKAGLENVADPRLVPGASI